MMDSENLQGYHSKKIEKGIFGEYSKIKEEFEELTDAFEQGDSILQICELCDLVGSIEEYIKRWNLTLDDLIKMKDKTKGAFLQGERK